MNPQMTVIIVVYNTTRIDLAWIPRDAEVFVVHNDNKLDAESVHHPQIIHIYNDINVGFGAAVNQAVMRAKSPRILLCNPDIDATTDHWSALSGESDEIVTVPLVDPAGAPTVTVTQYVTPLSLILNGYRASRWMSRNGRVRRILARVGMNTHPANEQAPSAWSLSERWPTGAFISLSRERFLSVGGFDENYFLYYEDMDLAKRLNQEYPEMRVRLALPPAGHGVGRSTVSVDDRARVEAARLESAIYYGSKQRGPGWRIAGRMLLLRRRLVFGNGGDVA